jgi:hypothetical protein
MGEEEIVSDRTKLAGYARVAWHAPADISVLNACCILL